MLRLLQQWSPESPAAALRMKYCKTRSKLNHNRQHQPSSSAILEEDPAWFRVRTMRGFFAPSNCLTSMLPAVSCSTRASITNKIICLVILGFMFCKRNNVDHFYKLVWTQTTTNYTRLVLVEFLLQFRHCQAVDLNPREGSGHHVFSEWNFPVITQLSQINVDQLRNSVLLNHEPLDAGLSRTG